LVNNWPAEASRLLVTLSAAKMEKLPRTENAGLSNPLRVPASAAV
jgi:hypothetical protein